MKYVRKIAALLLAASLILAVCACTPSKKIQNKVYEYLDSKYKGMEFELIDYTQDKETSGKYTFHAYDGQLFGKTREFRDRPAA